MSTLLTWFVFLVHLGMAGALVVVCAMNAKRVGAGVWLVAAFGAIDALFAIVYRVVRLIGPDDFASVMNVVSVVDAGFTAIGATLAFVGFVLLRR